MWTKLSISVDAFGQSVYNAMHQVRSREFTVSRTVIFRIGCEIVHDVT